jgi:1-acyl-sn-glycerol-3-phosphate acyltransferase
MDALAGETDPRVRPPPACWDALSTPPWGARGRDATLALVAAAGKLLLHGLNTTTVESPGGAARLEALVTDRRRRRLLPEVVVGAGKEGGGGGGVGVSAAAAAAGAAAATKRGPTPNPPPPSVAGRPRGLLTYSNHTSTFDDPGVLVALLPLSFFWTEHSHGLVRWTLCAREICFRNAALAAFFASGKAFPVERGGGGGGGRGGGGGAGGSGAGGGASSSSNSSSGSSKDGGKEGSSASSSSSSSSSKDGGKDSVGVGGGGGAGKNGLDQPAMAAAAHALGARGDWVHLFPEGRVYDFGKAAHREAAAAAEEAAGAWRREQRKERRRKGGGEQEEDEEEGAAPAAAPGPAAPMLGPFRQGVGKLVCDARAAAGGSDPVVVPLAHAGMERVLPRGRWLPRAGQRVRVAVGEPVDLSRWTCACEAQDARERARAWRDIAAALREAMSELQRTIED